MRWLWFEQGKPDENGKIVGRFRVHFAGVSTGLPDELEVLTARKKPEKI